MHLNAKSRAPAHFANPPPLQSLHGAPERSLRFLRCCTAGDPSSLKTEQYIAPPRPEEHAVPSGLNLAHRPQELLRGARAERSVPSPCGCSGIPATVVTKSEVWVRR
eukprot:2781742-Prymnesium_polylepis.2